MLDSDDDPDYQSSSDDVWTHLRLVSLAFAGSIGMTMVILACALPSFGGKWWPLFVVVFYLLSPLPTLMARRGVEAAGNAGGMHLAIFFTMGLIVSSFALPIVLWHAGVIMGGACALTVAGSAVVLLTVAGFFALFDAEDSDYTMW